MSDNHGSNISKIKSFIMKRKKLIIIIVCIFAVVISGLFLDSAFVGRELDIYKEVPVYYNGILITKSNGRNYSEDGYFYGHKWQCVEYIKRFYFDAKGHVMPNKLGNARDFFDPEVAHGDLNIERGMIQYHNGGDTAPQPDDLLVFTDSKYGHVAIITEVTDSEIEIIQQNVLWKTRDRLPLTEKNGTYIIGGANKPAGWLHLQNSHRIQS